MKFFEVLGWVGVFAFFPFIGIAQQGSGGWCAHNNYSRLFDEKTVEQFEATVVSVEKVTPETGMSAGVHLMVKPEKTSEFRFTSARLGILTIKKPKLWPGIVSPSKARGSLSKTPRPSSPCPSGKADKC